MSRKQTYYPLLFVKPIALLILLYISVAGYAQLDNVKLFPVKSEQVDEKYKWKLNELYESDSVWDIDYKWINNNVKYIKQYQEHLGDTPEGLIKYLEASYKLRLRLSKLKTYVQCKTLADLRNTKATQMLTRYNDLEAKVLSDISFFEPELLKMPEDKLWQYIESNPKLQAYRYMFKKILRNKKHILIWEKEEIIALIKPMTSIPLRTYTQLTNLDFATLRTTYPKYNKNPELLYKDHKYILSSLLNGEITVKRFFANVRNFNSALEAALFVDNTPTYVYTNLINNVSNNLKITKEWVGYKTALLKKDSITYDELFNTTIYKYEKTYLYDTSKIILSNALSVLGKKYNTLLQTAIHSHWIDVYRTEGKVSQSNTFFVPAQHPYILLNWENKIQNLLELAGESGKAVCYNLVTSGTGTYQEAPSSLITFIPAYVNQILLLEYMIVKATSKNELKFLYETYINLILHNFYNKTCHAEFEKRLYEDAELNTIISHKYLIDRSKEFHSKYYDSKLKFDDKSDYLWSMIPQFYNNFINYTYPIDFAVAMKLVDDFKTYNAKAVDDYLYLLENSNKDYPINIIQNYGIDIGSDIFLTPVFSKFNYLIDELKKLQ